MAHMSVKTSPELTHRITNRMQRDKKPTLSEYERHRYKSKTYGNVVIYTSGKLVCMGSDEQVDRFRDHFYDPSEEERSTEKRTDLPIAAEVVASYEKRHCNVIGTDEVGNGSYFGNLVVVASVLDPDTLLLAQKLGVADSKKVRDTKIRQIAPELIAKVKYFAYDLTNERYNAVVPSQYNAVSIKVVMHGYAINQLLKDGVAPNRIIVDGFTTPENWRRYAGTQQTTPVTELIEKAEYQYMAVAVSSIIARYLFLCSLDRASDELGMEIPSGSAESADEAGAAVLTKHGEEALRKYAKWHFGTTDKARAIACK